MAAEYALHRKLAEVMADAERIPKNGTYTGQGGFKYVLVGDAADAIRGALAKRNVSMLPSAVDVISETEHETRSGGTMTTLTIRTTWTLTDGDSGETAVIQSIGTGADAGDKASPKAQTNAMKYALLMGFLLSTGDDPEQSDSSDRGRRQPRQEPTPMRQHLEREPVPDKPVSLGVQTYDGAIFIKGGSDGEVRETTDGPLLIFGLQYDKGRVAQVQARGPLAYDIHDAVGNVGKALHGIRAIITGETFEVNWQAEDGSRRPPFKRMFLDRIETPDWTLEVPTQVPGQEAMDLA